MLVAPLGIVAHGILEPSGLENQAVVGDKHIVMAADGCFDINIAKAVTRFSHGRKKSIDLAGLPESRGDTKAEELMHPSFETVD